MKNIIIPGRCLVKFYTNTVSGNTNDKAGDAGYVYVLLNEQSMLCKIGVTYSPKSRISALKTQSGCNIKLILKIELHPNIDPDMKEIEKIMHSYFQNKRVIGEWFKLDLKDILKIRQLFWHIEGEGIEDNIKTNFHTVSTAMV